MPWALTLTLTLALQIMMEHRFPEVAVVCNMESGGNEFHINGHQLTKYGLPIKPRRVCGQVVHRAKAKPRVAPCDIQC